MMMKKTGKFLVAVLAVCLVCTGMVLASPGKASAAAAAPSSVGVVDYGALVTQHPDSAKANETLKAETEKAKKEFDSKSAGMNDKDKQALSMQLGKQLEQKRWELLGAIMNSVNAAIKDVATAKGLSIVVDKSAVLFGGQDITVEVGKKLSGK